LLNQGGSRLTVDRRAFSSLFRKVREVVHGGDLQPQHREDHVHPGVSIVVVVSLAGLDGDLLAREDVVSRERELFRDREADE
jgi:hypothetical protein